MLDKTSSELMRISALGHGCFVDRWAFHNCLGYDLPVQYNKRFLHYEEFEDSVVAHFEDDTKVRLSGQDVIVYDINCGSFLPNRLKPTSSSVQMVHDRW